VTIRLLGAAAAVVALAGCAVRLGGPAPEEYQALALIATDTDTPAQVAERIASAGADLVLLSAPSTRDSAWFAQIATAAALQQSGPGRTGDRALGFFTNNLELLGDTSIVLAAGAGRLHMHDALYQIEENRLVDLMLVTVDTVADLREAARTLLSYISTDVGATAAVVLGLSGPTPQASDSIGVLLRAYLPNAHGCAGSAETDGTAAEDSAVRLFYGPVVRVECLSARTLDAPGSPVTARLVVGR
jgi:hypothetical protein